MRSLFCAHCTSTNTVWSDHFNAQLCSDCFDDLCRDERDALTLEDLEELSEEIGI